MSLESTTNNDNFLSNIDVIIIGAGPVGAFTAAKLSEAGINVAVFERNKRDNIRAELGYIHFDVHMYNKLGLPSPTTESEIRAGTFEQMWQIPLNETKKFAIPYPTDILRMSGFAKWIIDFAEKSNNVKFFFEKAFESPIVEGIQIIGVNIATLGKVYGKIIIDCTGRFGVVRNSLPQTCGLPPLQTRPQRMFTVYMEEWDCPTGFPLGSNTYVCYKGFANQVAPTCTLVGASTLMGLESTKAMFKRLVNYHLNDITYETKSVFHSEVPFDFSPSSLVSDGFVTIGDSAFQNKPFSGEGMASGMEAALIAVPVIIKAIQTQKYSKEQLWAYNVNYFRTIGADFALIRGAGETLIEFTPEEFNWMYDAGFLSTKDMMDTWMNYRVKKSPMSLIITFFKGMKNLGIFKRILKGLLLGAKLRALYRKYPLSAQELARWENKVHKLL